MAAALERRFFNRRRKLSTRSKGDGELLISGSGSLRGGVGLLDNNSNNDDDESEAGNRVLYNFLLRAEAGHFISYFL